jgi:hypothetical protein
MLVPFLSGLKFVNQLLTAGIAITAFSLLLYALTFNLRDRVARTFALILICLVIVFVGDAISSVVSSDQMLQFWLQLEWVGILFLPACYFQLSEALLDTTGRQSRGSQRWFTRLFYLISLGFATLPLMLLGTTCRMPARHRIWNEPGSPGSLPYTLSPQWSGPGLTSGVHTSALSHRPADDA